VLDPAGSRSLALRTRRFSTFASCWRLLPFAALCCTERARKGQRFERRSRARPNGGTLRQQGTVSFARPGASPGTTRQPPAPALQPAGQHPAPSAGLKDVGRVVEHYGFFLKTLTLSASADRVRRCVPSLPRFC
jgi:hypothetical protein